jgi:hypothetical protein
MPQTIRQVCPDPRLSSFPRLFTEGDKEYVKGKKREENNTKNAARRLGRFFPSAPRFTRTRSLWYVMLCERQKERKKKGKKTKQSSRNTSLFPFEGSPKDVVVLFVIQRREKCKRPERFVIDVFLRFSLLVCWVGGYIKKVNLKMSSCVLCSCVVVGWWFSVSTQLVLYVFSCMHLLYRTHSPQRDGGYALIRASFIISAIVTVVPYLVGDSVPPGGSSPLPD